MYCQAAGTVQTCKEWLQLVTGAGSGLTATGLKSAAAARETSVQCKPVNVACFLLLQRCLLFKAV